MVQLSHAYMTAGKTIALTRWTFVSKVMSPLFNTCHRFPSKEQASFNFMATSPSTMILEIKKIKSVTVSIFPHLFAMKSWNYMSWSLFFEHWALSQHFHSLLSTASRGSLVPLRFPPLEWYHLHIWGCWYFFQQHLIPACDSFIPAFLVIDSTYTLNKSTRPSRTNNKKDVLFIMGDLNKKLGSQEIPGVTDKFGLGVQNEAGQRLTEFCQENTVFIVNTIF